MKSRLTILTAGLLLSAQAFAAAEDSRSEAKTAGGKPNIIVILTDDQGYGDLSCHGNPVLKTPSLDKLHGQSIRLTDFHVAPICTPTRSQLMTGRDSLANGAYCVCSGHEFIRAGLPTMPEIFAAHGYRTGLFGKWHLGDNYPYRPKDRGFQEVLTFGGHGLTAMATYWDSEYMDPWFCRNGKWERFDGYCTDVLFDESMEWMKGCAEKREPFLLYLPTNAAHQPVQVPEKYAKPYAQMKGKAAGFFGMIANLDGNIGRLDAFLDETGLAENTIVIFMTDNGSYKNMQPFNAGMRGYKGEYYEGGHRVPCFIRWPAGGLRPAGDVDHLTQSQDLLPTLIDLCGLPRPKGAAFDGSSLAPLLRGKEEPSLDERMCVVQCALWDEYEHANKWTGAVLWKIWRLIGGKALYDLRDDPAQKRNVSAQHPEIVEKMRAHYEQWWEKSEPLSRDFPPIHLGSEHEPITVLTSNNRVAPNASDQVSIRGGVRHNGPWHVAVERAGEYEISLRRWPAETKLPLQAAAPPYRGKLANYPAGKSLPIGQARLKVGAIDETKPATKDSQAVFRVTLPAGRTTLQTWFSDASGKELCGAYYVYVKRMK